MKKIKIILYVTGILFAANLTLSCNKEDSSNQSNFETGTLTDIDGNVYKSIKIGDQWWMAENLRVSKFRNGDEISYTATNSEWRTLTIPSYCYYNNGFEAYAQVYGFLYNWKAASDSRNIAPEGWHVPTEAEWRTMVDYLGGSAMAGGKMKEAGTKHWFSPNTGATNSSGFSALPSGSRGASTGEFGWLGTGNDYWSISANSYIYAWAFYVGNNITDCLQLSHNKNNGFAIRCVKD